MIHIPSASTSHLLCPWLLAAAVLAQAPSVRNAPTPPAALSVWPAGLVLQDQAEDGTLWVAGDAWKAAFDRDGLLFQPFVGSTHPSLQARFSLAAVQVGTTNLELRAAEPAVHDQRVGYDRGVVTEFYDLRSGGVEQQFLLRELPHRGELRLSIAVSTALAAHHEGGEILFCGPGGGIRYGRAVAIDARGERLELDTVIGADGVQLVVPGAFVAGAALPLLIDPMIGPITSLSPSTAVLSNTDMAFDQSLGQFFVCYERAFSATDHDVYVACFDASMQFQALLTVDYTSEYWSKPKIAVLEAFDQACVVAETSTGNVAPFAVRARLLDGGPTPVVRPPFLVAGTAVNQAVEPDVGGDASPTGPSCYLVVYERRGAAQNVTTLHAQRIEPTGTVSAANFVTTGGGFARRVALGKTCGDLGAAQREWAMVFRNEDYQQSTGRMRVGFVSRLGTVRFIGGTMHRDLTATTENAGSEWDVSSPMGTGLQARLLSVERRVDPQTGRGRLLGHVFDREGLPVVSDVLLGGTTLDRFRPVADSDGIRFVMAHAVRYSATDVDIRCSTWALVGGQLVVHDAASTTTSVANETAPALCAQRGAGVNGHGLAWVHQTAAGFALECQRYRGVAGGGFASRATGCGDLLTLRSGNPALGESFTLALSNASGLCGFVIGVPVSLPVGPCPGCTQGADGVTALGPTTVLSVPPRPELVGVGLSAQGFRFGGAGLPCLGQIELGNTLDFVVQ